MMKKLLLAVPLMLLFPFVLSAQEHSIAEVYGGYQLIHDSDLNLNGFIAAVEGNVTPSLGIVGEFGFGTKSISELGIDVSTKAYTFMGGPRLSYRADKFRAFGHVLVGGNRLSVSTDMMDMSVGASTTGFSMALGGGIDVVLNSGISIRPVQLDWLHTRFSVMGESAWENQLRYSAGIIFKLGKK
jgi:opacity protein-like surface antigen